MTRLTTLRVDRLRVCGNGVVHKKLLSSSMVSPR
jgi:hypothetical protein